MSPHLRAHLPGLLIGLLATLLVAATPLVAVPVGKSAPPAPSPAAAVPSSREPLTRPLSEIVTRQRKIIVLMNGARSLDEDARERAAIVGRLLYSQNHEALDELGNRLQAELAQSAAGSFATAPAELGAFLDTLERGPGLRDADKLVFRDVVMDLADALREKQPNEAGQKLLARLDEDVKGLAEIRALYEKELDQIFGQLETRALTLRRERWEAYVAFLAGLYSRQAILKEFEAELGALDDGQRGGGKAPRRKVDPLVIDGLQLPPMTVVLTFDDGPHPKHTPAILDTLEKYKVKSIFFACGKNVGAPGEGEAIKEVPTAELVRRELKAGHLLANHTYSHPFLPKLGAEKLTREIDQSKRILESASHSRLSLFRPPYGAHNTTVDAALQERKLKAYLWSVDSLDWSDPVPKSIADRVVRDVESSKRGVILMHDIHRQSAEALPLILETLQKRGYRFVLWDGETILGDPAAARGDAVATPRVGKALYRESHAVVVGINEYQTWPKLSYAVNDAQAIRDLLVNKFLFKPQNVHLLLNREATRDRILSVLGDQLSDPGKVDHDDRVFFFFAGHGVTRKLPNGRAIGYIVPVDADTKNYQASAISMTNFQDISEAIPAKHVFYVMDACYSGLALTRGGPAGADPRNYLEEVTRRMTREVLTAGGADEQVADRGPNGHSIFTWTLLQGLEGRADLNNDGYLTATELASYVAPAVSSLSRQTPAFGSMVGSEGGEFVLELNHSGEFLTEMSTQLDQSAVQINAELENVRKLIAEKEARNKALAGQLAQEEAKLAALEPSSRGNPGQAPAGAPAAPDADEQARRENDRGMQLYREKKYEEALTAFKHAAMLAPQDAQSANNVGFLLFKLERLDEAVPWLEKTVQLAPSRGPAYVNLGDTYDKLGKKEDAVKAFKRYLELMPSSRLAERVKKRVAELQ